MHRGAKPGSGDRGTGAEDERQGEPVTQNPELGHLRVQGEGFGGVAVGDGGPDHGVPKEVVSGGVGEGEGVAEDGAGGGEEEVVRVGGEEAGGEEGGGEGGGGEEDGVGLLEMAGGGAAAEEVVEVVEGGGGRWAPSVAGRAMDHIPANLKFTSYPK